MTIALLLLIIVILIGPHNLFWFVVYALELVLGILRLLLVLAAPVAIVSVLGIIAATVMRGAA